jgi:hypothetical protein
VSTLHTVFGHNKQKYLHQMHVQFICVYVCLNLSSTSLSSKFVLYIYFSHIILFILSILEKWFILLKFEINILFLIKRIELERREAEARRRRQLEEEEQKRKARELEEQRRRESEEQRRRELAKRQREDRKYSHFYLLTMSTSVLFL